jgi:D-methionine transport system substrate-binding protein
LTNHFKESINNTIPIGIIGIKIFQRRIIFMKMKKFLAVAGSIVLGVSTLAGCGSSSTTTTTDSDSTNETVAQATTEATEETTAVETETETEQETTVESKGTITVAASATPHAEILEYAAPILEKQGWDLEVTVFDDYVQPNLVVDSGEFDANYFQHIPYLENFNEERGTDLVNAGGIHYEPFGIYPGTKSSLDDIADGDTISVPNDTTNEARALLLLEANGIITLKDGVGLEATVKDIESYNVDIKIQELEAAQVSRVTDEVAYVVLNGNYALEAGYSVGKDALAYETSDSEAAKTYVNVIAVKAGNEDSEKIQALVDVLKSDEVKQYIEDTYDGAVIPFEE